MKVSGVKGKNVIFASPKVKDCQFFFTQSHTHSREKYVTITNMKQAQGLFFVG